MFHQAETLAHAVQYIYPTSGLLSFLAVKSICLYTVGNRFPQINGGYVRAKVILSLIFLIVATYVCVTPLPPPRQSCAQDL